MAPWRDLDQVRRGWRWDGPRPRSWPPRAPAIPESPSNLGWARAEPVRSLRWLIQHGLSMPLAEAMAQPQVDGQEWLRELDRPVILASNHVSHADTPLLLYALPERVREQTVVAAAEDYWYQRPWLGRAVALWLNTFPFSRTGSPQAVLHHASQLLKSGWNLLYYAEGTRSPDGRLREFKPGIGFLAIETHTPVVPVHLRGSHRIMPKGRGYPLPAPVSIRIGKPLAAVSGEGSRAFTRRIEDAVRTLADGRRDQQVVGSWIERWQASAPRARGAGG